MNAIPLIDVSPLVSGHGDVAGTAEQMGRACRDAGFFYVAGHGIDEALQGKLEKAGRRFFGLALEEKMRIRMALGGRAWRGYFPVGQELTSGKPDVKEGLYFGTELADNDPRVRAGWPLHGRNLFPDRVPELEDTVLSYMLAMTRLGHQLMSGIALSLDLESTYFSDRYMSDPLVLFRMFHYPPTEIRLGGESPWGVGEHTDYGVLTILKQGDVGGLQVKSGGAWITAQPIPNTFVCNIGDMLDFMTRGRYRSTPHRVRNVNPVGRLSFPFFFDPSFDAEIEPVVPPGETGIRDDSHERWDRSNVHAFEGTYGAYLMDKVGKVFPGLASRVGGPEHP